MRIKALMAFNQPFIPLESPSTKSRLTQAKLVYFLMQLVIMGMGVYKVWVMGLLPTSGSDFLAWKAERPVRQSSHVVMYVEANFAGRGMECCVKLHSNLALFRHLYSVDECVHHIAPVCRYKRYHNAMPMFPRADSH